MTPHFPFPQPLAITNLLFASIWIWLLQVLHINKIIQYLFCCVWLISLSIMFLSICSMCWNLIPFWKWKSLSPVWPFATAWSVHEIFQARILEWVAFPFSRGSSQPRDSTQVSRIAGRFFTNWAIREALIPFWDQIIFHCMAISHFIHSFIDEHWVVSTFRLLWIMPLWTALFPWWSRG